MNKSLDYQLIDAVEASIYWKDLSGKYLGCNKYMTKMAGISREEIVGSTDYTLPWKNQADAITNIDKMVIESKKKYEIEETPTISGNINKVFLSTKSPLLDDSDNIIGIIGVSIDITHFRKIKQEFEDAEKTLSQYLSIKNRFLKNISHESRIPIGSVLSITESLKNNWEKYDDKIKRESIDLLYKEANRLSNFILNTFDVSNFTNNEIKLDLKKHDFAKTLKETIETYKKSFFDDQINISIDIPEDYIFAFDKKLIGKVIENLLMNAVQYSPQDKNIHIKVNRSSISSIPAMHCSVTDEGVGVPDEEMNTIFEVFSESSRTASKACGVGLGLSLCKEIIDAHYGEIWGENNNSQKGSTFHFTIPTNLIALSTDTTQNQEEQLKHQGRIFTKELAKIYPDYPSRPFALAGISPFNSYFSEDKIFEICEWLHSNYDEFGFFIPDQISKYTFEALGYDESRIHRKTKKQDNYTINKVKKALSRFYEKHPDAKTSKIHIISEMKENKDFQTLYKKYSEMFIKDKAFRKGCLETTEWVLSNNKDKARNIEEIQKNIAVQYFLYELPVMTHATTILGFESCDFVYHSLPHFLKNIYLNNELVENNQNFLVLS